MSPQRHANADTPKTRSVKRILVFMATSTRSLIDPARAALPALRGAVKYALRTDPADGHERVVKARVFVAGYQLEAGIELGTWTFTVDAVGTSQFSFGWPDPKPDYIPGDYTALGDWLSQALREDPPDSVDSTVLIVWGHGAGVAIDPQFIDALKKNARPQGGNCAKPAVDIVVLDSCLMASIELAHEFRPLTRYLIASQTLVSLEPGGSPGVNLGEIASAFLAEDAWRAAGESPSTSTHRHVSAAANGIVNIIGDSRSGAQQLTLFQLESLGEIGNHGALPADKLTSLSVGELLGLFSTRLIDAVEDSNEQPRLLEAFRRAAFLRVRQFVDLQDLARQVHLRSRSVPLQRVALALAHALEPSAGGFIVRNRTVVAAGLERRRFSGVTIYCPWFLADTDVLAAPAINVLADHDAYRRLDCPRETQWAEFVLGSLFEATLAERQAQDAPREGFPGHAAAPCCWFQHGQCCCRHTGLHAVTERARLWDNKPSGTASGPRGGSIVVFGSPTYDDAF